MPVLGSRYRRYPEYRDSGVEWLGAIPSHWKCVRLKYLTRSPTKSEVRTLPADTMVSFLPMEAVGENGELALEQDKTLGTVLDGYTYFRDSDVLVAKITPCFENGKGTIAAGLANGIGFGTTELHVLRTTRDLQPEFLFYSTRSHAFRKLGESWMYGAGGQKRVPDSFVSEFRQAVPSPDEQTKIAAFLGRETSKIDALIAKKEQLLISIEQHSIARMTRALTLGFMSESVTASTIWFGEIPRHWKVGTLSRWWQVLDCKHRTVSFTPGGFPVVSIGEVQGLELDLSTAKRTSEAEFRHMISGGREPRVEDIIYSRNATVGAAAIVTTPEPFCLGQDVSLIRSEAENQHYLLFLLRSPSIRRQLEAAIVGSTFARINVADIKRLIVLRPPREEQDEIAAFCWSVHRTTAALVDRVRAAIVQLRSLRSSLITAAVTGKIDIREEVA